MIKYIFKKYAYFYISLQRIFVLIRMEPQKQIYHKYLKCAYWFMINIDKLFEYTNFLKFKTILNESVILDDELGKIEYILYEDKRYSLCDNYKYIYRNKKYLIKAIEYCFELIKKNNAEQLYDLVDILEAFVEAILIKNKFGKKDFQTVYIDKFNKKWKVNIILFA